MSREQTVTYVFGSYRTFAVPPTPARCTFAVPNVSSSPNVLTHREMTETRKLVELARQGDSDAFERLVRTHMRGAYAVAFGVLGDSADAEDVCQDAFISALGQLDRCDPDRFAPWLMRIVRNRAISVHRQQKVRHSLPLEWALGAASSDRPDREEVRSRIREQLSEAVKHLPPRQREVLLLHDLEGWKHREIGELLGIPEGTVRYTLFQARRAARARLERRDTLGEIE
jgi:RNA polymerase sigma-70 factor, ECF subfamily